MRKVVFVSLHHTRHLSQQAFEWAITCANGEWQLPARWMAETGWDVTLRLHLSRHDKDPTTWPSWAQQANVTVDPEATADDADLIFFIQSWPLHAFTREQQEAMASTYRLMQDFRGPVVCMMGDPRLLPPFELTEKAMTPKRRAVRLKGVDPDACIRGKSWTVLLNTIPSSRFFDHARWCASYINWENVNGDLDADRIRFTRAEFESINVLAGPQFPSAPDMSSVREIPYGYCGYPNRLESLARLSNDDCSPRLQMLGGWNAINVAHLEKMGGRVILLDPEQFDRVYGYTSRRSVGFRTSQNWLRASVMASPVGVYKSLFGLHSLPTRVHDYALHGIAPVLDTHIIAPDGNASLGDIEASFCPLEEFWMTTQCEARDRGFFNPTHNRALARLYRTYMMDTYHTPAAYELMKDRILRIFEDRVRQHAVLATEGVLR